MRAFRQEVEVEIRQNRRKPVGILDVADATFGLDAQAIREPRGSGLEISGKEPRMPDWE
jgi:hypothetical protein